LRVPTVLHAIDISITFFDLEEDAVGKREK